MIQCIIQFLSGRRTHTHTQIHKQRNTHRRTPGEPRKSQSPGGRKSYEHLRRRWPVGENRVRCLSCCECNPPHFILSMTAHLGRSPWLCVCVCVCVCVWVFVWVWTYVQTATRTEANLPLIPACGLARLSAHILSFRVDCGKLTPASTHCWYMLTVTDRFLYYLSYVSRKPALYLVIQSCSLVKQGVQWKTERQGRVTWSRREGEGGGKRRRRLMEEELPLGY